MSPLPCSKEIYPVGMHLSGGEINKRPKVVAHYMLEKMRLAGVLNAFFIIRKGKWDIPGYFGDGALPDINMGYLMMNLPYGTAYTVNQAYPFVKDKTVVFGFPDILFTPEDAFGQLLSKKKSTHADIVLGLFPVDNPQKMDLVVLDDNDRVCGIVIKPSHTSLLYTWIIAVWSERFTEFIHNHVTADIDLRSSNTEDGLMNGDKELHIGHTIQSAILNGLKIESVIFTNGKYIDIGTPEDLEKVYRNDSGILEG